MTSTLIQADFTSFLKTLEITPTSTSEIGSYEVELRVSYKMANAQVLVVPFDVEITTNALCMTDVLTIDAGNAIF